MNIRLGTLVFLITVIFLERAAMSAPVTEVAKALPAVVTYDELLSAIREAKAESRERVEALVEQEKVRQAWEIGSLIETHILQHKPRANYDEQVIERLSKDLDSSSTEIWYMLEFARAYPILPPAGELSWSHYRELLSLNDSKERQEVAAQAMQQHWGRDQVREEVRKRQASKKPAGQRKPAQTVLSAVPGKPGTYQVVKAHYGNEPNHLVLDLGFSSYLSLEQFSSKRWPHKPLLPADKQQGHSEVTAFKEGDIVLAVGAQGPPLRILKDATDADLFTYPASVVGVIDGDSVPRITAQEMRAGPSKPICGSGLQSALSGMSQKPMS